MSANKKKTCTVKMYSLKVFVKRFFNQQSVLITILTTTAGRSEENMFLKFIFFSSLGDAVKPPHDLFFFL